MALLARIEVFSRTFPVAEVDLSAGLRLLPDELYSLTLDMELPPIEANVLAGMFVVCLELAGKEDTVVAAACRPAMLQHVPWAAELLDTMMLAPARLAGLASTAQRISVEFMSAYNENVLHPALKAKVRLHSHDVSMSAAYLNVHAHFDGLRGHLHRHPVLSSIVGVSSVAAFLLTLVLFAWKRTFGLSSSSSRAEEMRARRERARAALAKSPSQQRILKKVSLNEINTAEEELNEDGGLSMEADHGGPRQRRPAQPQQ